MKLMSPLRVWGEMVMVYKIMNSMKPKPIEWVLDKMVKDLDEFWIQIW